MPFEREHRESQTVAVALAQFSLAVGLEQQRQVGKTGHGVLPAKGTVEQHMQGSTGQPLFATDDMGDFHEMVVDDVGQMIGGQLVGTLEEHLVVEDVALDDHIAAYHVVDMDVLARLYLEAHHILVAVGNELLHLVGRHGERIAHHATGVGVILEVFHLGTLGLKFLGGVEGDVGLVLGQQLLHIFLVDGAALTLAIGSMAATVAHPLVKLDAEPLERLDDILLGTGHKTCGIGVLDSENKFATVLACEKVIVQCGAHTADMQRPCGTWCKTHPYFPFCHPYNKNKMKFCAKLQHFWKSNVFFSYFRRAK